jgi:hypothetical protein
VPVTKKRVEEHLRQDLVEEGHNHVEWHHLTEEGRKRQKGPGGGTIFIVGLLKRHGKLEEDERRAHGIKRKGLALDFQSKFGF